MHGGTRYIFDMLRDSTTVLRYEIKFSIDETQAQQVLDWAVGYLTLDSHATNAEEGTLSDQNSLLGY
jgi:hypothetical protein